MRTAQLRIKAKLSAIAAFARKLYNSVKRFVRSKMEPSKNVGFAVMGVPLNTLIVQLSTKLSREWPEKYDSLTGIRELFVMHLRAAHLAFLSAHYLVVETPPDPRRLPEFCTTLPLLNRAILDSLLTILFFLEDLPARTALFRESDWRETRLELERYRAEFGSNPNPNWQDYLRKLAKVCDMNLALTSLTPEQVANPSALKTWPNPGAMVAYGVSPKAPLSPSKAYMKYLNDFFYTDLSQQAKLGGMGYVKRAAFLIEELRRKPGMDDQIKRYTYAQMGQAVALLLSLASELEMHFNFGLREQIIAVWKVSCPLVEVVNEVYQKRYSELFG
jgi:hypothetical protein